MAARGFLAPLPKKFQLICMVECRGASIALMLVAPLDYSDHATPTSSSRVQNIEVGPDGLWRVEEALAASLALAKAGDGMSAHNKGRLDEIRSKLTAAHQRGQVSPPEFCTL